MDRRQLAPAERSVLVFTLAYLAAAGAGVVLTGNREFFVYLTVVAAVVGAVFTLHRRIRFSPALLWGLGVLGAAHMAGGLLPAPEEWPVEGRRVLYNLWLVPDVLKFDQAVHFYGSAVGTCACWQWVRASAALTRPTAGAVTLSVLAGIGLGAINETVEFLTTRVVADTNVGGFENTGWDLVSNLIGAVTAGVLILIKGSRARGALQAAGLGEAAGAAFHRSTSAR